MEADLRELARLPDVLEVCSSAGWTDQKHMLYLSLLQESFVNQLHEGETSLKGHFSLSPTASRHKQSSKADRAKPVTKAELVRSTTSEHQEDGEVLHSMDDDASSTETVQESSSSQASAPSSGQSSSTSHFGKRKVSLSRTAADSHKRTTYPFISSEGSGQNFVDEGTTGSRGSSRPRSNKRLKVCWRHGG